MPFFDDLLTGLTDESEGTTRQNRFEDLVPSSRRVVNPRRRAPFRESEREAVDEDAPARRAAVSRLSGAPRPIASSVAPSRVPTMAPRDVTATVADRTVPGLKQSLRNQNPTVGDHLAQMTLGLAVEHPIETAAWTAASVLAPEITVPLGIAGKSIRPLTALEVGYAGRGAAKAGMYATKPVNRALGNEDFAPSERFDVSGPEAAMEGAFGLILGKGAARGVRTAERTAAEAAAPFEDALFEAEQRAAPYRWAKQRNVAEVRPSRLLAERSEPFPTTSGERQGPGLAMPEASFVSRATPETRPERLLNAPYEPRPTAGEAPIGPAIPSRAVAPDIEGMFGVVPPERRLARGPLVPPAPVDPVAEASRWAVGQRAKRVAAGESGFDMEDFIARRRGEPTAAEVERAALRGDPLEAPAEPARAPKNAEGYFEDVKTGGGVYRKLERVSNDGLMRQLAEYADERLGTQSYTPAAKAMVKRLDAIEAELERRGLTQEQIWGPELEKVRAAKAAQKSAEQRAADSYVGPDEDTSFDFGPRAGAARVPVVSALGGAAVGAAGGGMVGDTPEERRRNALLGAVAGGAGAWMVGRRMDRSVPGGPRRPRVGAVGDLQREGPWTAAHQLEMGKVRAAETVPGEAPDLLPAMERERAPVQGNRTGAVGDVAKVGGARSALADNRAPKTPLEALVSDIESQGIQLDLLPDARDGSLTLSRIIVPKEMRKQGVGTTAMERIIAFADAEGKTVRLSPATDFGGTSKKRLRSFYKRFGFVENKGRNKDFRSNETMYRKPQGKNRTSTIAAVDEVDEPTRSAWFKGSRVVGEKGEPLTVYHGTGTARTIQENGFSPEFIDKGMDQLGSGFYFTNKKETADLYTTYRNLADQPKLGGESSPGVVEVQLAIKNPIVVKNGERPSIKVTPAQIRKILKMAPELRDPDGPLGNWGDVRHEGFAPVFERAAQAYGGGDVLAMANDFFPNKAGEFNRAIQKVTGHDGVVLDFPETGEKHYVAWFPEQIRQFNPETGKLRARLGFMAPEVAGGVGGAGVGAVAGSTQGDTPEEKRRNAVAGAIAGAAGGTAAFLRGPTTALRRGATAVGVGTTGALLAQSDDEKIKATGVGLMGLATVHAIGLPRLKAAGKAAGGVAVEALKTSETGRKVLDLISHDILADPQVKTLIGAYQEGVAFGKARAAELSKESAALGPAADRKVSDIIEREAFEPTPLGTDQTIALAVAQRVSDEFTALGRAKVDARLLAPETVAKREGKYLPRMYAGPLAETATGAAPRATVGGRKPRIVGDKMRDESLTPAVRTQLGEVREASFRTAVGLEKGYKDVAAAKLFEGLAEIPGVIHPDYKTATDAWFAARQMVADDPTWRTAVRDARKEMDALSKQFKNGTDGYVRLPDTPGLGVLRGAVVRKDVADYLNGIPGVSAPAGNAMSLLKTWKRIHTVLNPGTHVGNTVSNSVIAHMSGVPIWEQAPAIRAALKDYNGYGESTRYLAEKGILDRGLPTAGDAVPSAGQQMKPALEELARTTRPATARVLKEGGIEPLSPVRRKLRKLNVGAERLYSKEDGVFRVMVFDRLVKGGMEKEAAAKYVDEAFVNYETRSPLLGAIKNTVSPFIMYPVKAIPFVAGQIVEHPLRWMSLAAAWGAMDQYAQNKVGKIAQGDLRPAQRTNKYMGYLEPGTTQLPMVNARGDRYMTDIGRWTPFSALTGAPMPGSITSHLSDRLPGIVQPTGPLVELGARAYNTDPFTGDKWIKSGDDARDITGKIIGAGANMALPSALSFHVPRVARDIQNADPKAAAVDALGLVGARPSVVRPGMQGTREARLFEEARRNILADLRYALRANKDPKRAETLKARAQRKIEALAKEYREGRGEVTP